MSDLDKARHALRLAGYTFATIDLVESLVRAVIAEQKLERNNAEQSKAIEDFAAFGSSAVLVESNGDVTRIDPAVMYDFPLNK